MNAKASETDPAQLDQVADAAIAIIRSLFARTAIMNFGPILATVPRIAIKMQLGLDLELATKECLTEAISLLPDPDRRMMQIRGGLLKGWSATDRRTREDRKLAAADIYGRSASATAIAESITTRRVEQYEKEVISYRVAAELLANVTAPALMTSNGSTQDRPIFAQFVNPEVGRLYGLAGRLADPAHFASIIDQSVKLSLLASSGGLILPASYLWEVKGVSTYLSNNLDLVESGVVRLTGPVLDLEGYRQIKLEEYRDDRENPYREALEEGHTLSTSISWMPRGASTAAEDISSNWRSAIMPGGPFYDIVERTARLHSEPRDKVQRMMSSIPERLQGRAFISRFIAPEVLDKLGPSRRAVDQFISQQYIQSYTRDLDARVLVELPYSDMAVGLSGEMRRLRTRSARSLIRELSAVNLSYLLQANTPVSVVADVSQSQEYKLLSKSLFGANSPGLWTRVWTAMDGRRETDTPSAAIVKASLQDILEVVAQ